MCFREPSGLADDPRASYFSSPRKMIKYNIYFDNYFCSSDLLVHLRNIGVRATGTV